MGGAVSHQQSSSLCVTCCACAVQLRSNLHTLNIIAEYNCARLTACLSARPLHVSLGQGRACVDQEVFFNHRYAFLYCTASDLLNSNSHTLVQAPDELEKRSDSYALALRNRCVTLKAWSPQRSHGDASGHAHSCPALSDSCPRPNSDGQVLEGQGRGLFLGPPAQRWAADSALKESMNR